MRPVVESVGIARRAVPGARDQSILDFDNDLVLGAHLVADPHGCGRWAVRGRVVRTVAVHSAAAEGHVPPVDIAASVDAAATGTGLPVEIRGSVLLDVDQ